MTVEPQTLMQKYYALNEAISLLIKSYSLRCPVVQFGVDPARLKDASRDQTVNRYPYIQTHLLNPKPNAWTSFTGGVLTRFEYQLSFFTSPENEFENQSELLKPFYVARMAFSDISLNAFLRLDEDTGQNCTIANVLDVTEKMDFSMVSGAPTPKAVLIARMETICGYPVSVPDSTLATDPYSGILLNEEN